jgi:hypothetical protein
MYSKLAKETRWIRLSLSKIKFACGLTPIIDLENDPGIEYIPPGKKAVCLISADFEMAWAFRYLGTNDTTRDPVTMGMQTRTNVPQILEYCDKYKIPITWATVGHLFLEFCRPEKGTLHPEIPRPNYYTNPYWAYDRGDWFDNDPGTDFLRDPAWYAPDLIREIRSRSTQHEIGCHTFSHIDASEQNCSREVFVAEIERCKALAKTENIDLKSFVHPGHRLGYIDELKNHGFTSFRTDGQNVLAPPKRHKSGLWEFRNTSELVWREGWTSSYHLKRLKKIVDRSINANRVCVFWFHPSVDERFTKQVFPGLLEYLDNKRGEIASLTHNEYTAYLNSLV